MKSATVSERYCRRARRFLGVLMLASLLWWLLAGVQGFSSPFGMVAILGAAVTSLWTLPKRSFCLRWSALPGFVLYFLWASVTGGFDVARRALAPALPIQPGFLVYATRLPRGAALTFFMAVISLLPGTLSVRLEGRRLWVHVLDNREPIQDSLAHLEGRVDRLLMPVPRRGGAG